MFGSKFPYFAQFSSPKQCVAMLITFFTFPNIWHFFYIFFYFFQTYFFTWYFFFGFTVFHKIDDFESKDSKSFEWYWTWSHLQQQKTVGQISFYSFPFDWFQFQWTAWRVEQSGLLFLSLFFQIRLWKGHIFRQRNREFQSLFWA